MKPIKHILMLLLSATAVLSCSVSFDMEFLPEGSEPDIEFALEISGEVSDTGTDKPLEDIQITIQAIQKETVVYTKTAYTDNRGRFEIILDGSRRPSSIIATAVDMKNEYDSNRHEMLISWNSNYNIIDGVYHITNCNFHLKKAR